MDLADNFHPQERPDTCTIASNRMVLERMAGRKLTERELVRMSEREGWYEDMRGTTRTALVGLFAALGVKAINRYAMGVQELARELRRSKAIIVDVDARTWYAQEEIPDGIGYAVIVTSVDRNSSGSYSVIVDDPSRESGGYQVDEASRFLTAWDIRHNFMVVVDRKDW